LTNEQKDLIASALITQKYYKNQTIIQEGDPGSAFYIIKEGSASVSKGNKFIRKLNKGDSFGEQSLYYNTIRQLTIKADDEVTCLVLGRDTLGRVLGDKIHEVTFKNFIRWAFEKNQILSKLSKPQV
jgi:CRP-like cAMP-binding protein